MQFSLLTTPTTIYEFPERYSNMFYKNNYRMSMNISTKIIAQKEYTKTLELLFSTFYFYFFILKPTHFKTNILSTGVSKKEQIHRATLSIFKIGKDNFSLFSFHFQNFLFLLNLVYSNFYQTNSKYFIKKNRFLKNSSILSIKKIYSFAPSSLNKVSKSRILYMQYLMSISGFYSNNFI
jgi:hypothetical protein